MNTYNKRQTKILKVFESTLKKKEVVERLQANLHRKLMLIHKDALANGISIKVLDKITRFQG